MGTYYLADNKEIEQLSTIFFNTCFDHIHNKDILQRYGIASITDKMIGRQWYGHILCANSNTIAQVGLQLEVSSKPLKSQPKQRWLDTLHGDLRTTRLPPDQANN